MKALRKVFATGRMGENGLWRTGAWDGEEGGWICRFPIPAEGLPHQVHLCHLPVKWRRARGLHLPPGSEMPSQRWWHVSSESLPLSLHLLLLTGLALSDMLVWDEGTRLSRTVTSTSVLIRKGTLGGQKKPRARRWLLRSPQAEFQHPLPLQAASPPHPRQGATAC